MIDVKTGGLHVTGRVWAIPADGPFGIRHKGGVTLTSASERKLGTCCPDAKGDIQAEGLRKDESTDAGHRGGDVRSRVEGPVMGLDRRGVIDPSVQTLRMAFGEDGQVMAMEHAAAAGWPTQITAAFFIPKGKGGAPYDPFAISRADHWYDVGAQKVRAISNDLANSTFRPGWLRSVGPGRTTWAVESLSTKLPTTRIPIRLPSV